MDIYDTDRHEPLCAHRWETAAAEAEIVAIISDIAASALPGCGWPLHPLDAESFRTRETKWCLYSGAAGVIVALEILRGQGYAAPDLRYQLPLVHASYLRAPDADRVEDGLHLGEIGILAPAVLGDSANSELTARLHNCMTTIVDHDAYEITSGQAGMMHAALALHAATGEDGWKHHFRNGAEALWRNWKQGPDSGGWYWESRLFGQNRRYYGAGHGIAGNVGVLLRGADLLPGGLLETILDRTAQTLEQAAVRNDGAVNWFASAPPVKGRLFVQWCHGAAGIATALSRTPKGAAGSRGTINRLVDEAATLTWRAGPLKKGAGICHGTAGNGYAFLAIYRRTGEPKWLDRARAFAAHAILQCRRDRKRFGQGRYSLMTGDAGLAIYLHHCLHPTEPLIPGLEQFG